MFREAGNSRVAFSWGLLVVLLLVASPAVAQITEIIDATGDGGGNPLDAPELQSIATDMSGNVFVVGNGSNNVFKITPGGTITEIIDSTGDSTNSLTSPRSVAVDTSGNVFVTGQGTDNAFKITPGGVITQIIDSTGDGGGNTLDEAYGIAVDSSDNVIVTGLITDNAFRITPGGTITQIITSSGDGGGNALDQPYGAAADGLGNVYVAGFNSDNVFKIDSGGTVTEIIDPLGDGGGNPLNGPFSVDADAAGNVYVTGFSSRNAFEITSGGTITEIIDSTGDGGGNTLNGAMGVAKGGPLDDVYVTGFSSDNAFRIESGGTITEVIDSTGDGGGNTLDGATAAAVDSSGNAFITGFVTDNAFKIDAPNQPPVCVVDTPVTVDCGTLTSTTVMLDGSASDDPDMDVLSFQWSTSDCPSASFTAATSDSTMMTFTPSSVPFSCTATLQVSDAEDMVTCDVTINVNADAELPTISCPTDITQSTDAGVCNAVVNYTVPAGSDDCGVASVVCTPDTGTTFSVGTTMVTCEVTDTAGKTNQCTFDVTVEDDEDPTISCPTDITQDADAGMCGATVNFATPTGADNCGVAMVECTPSSGSFFNIGTTEVTCEVTDTSGNTAMCTFDVTVEDNEEPTITCPANVVTTTDAGVCTAVVNYSTPSGSDNCGVDSVVCTPPSGSTFAVGTTEVTCVVTDTSGNTNECTFDVTVNDEEDPTIACPANVVTTTDAGLCTAVVNYATPSTGDNCGVAMVVCTPPSGSTFSLGTTQVTCVVTDTSGNTNECTFDVTVNDEEDPTITCPANVVTTTDAGVCSAVVNYATPSGGDNCGVSSVVCTPPSGSTFNVGTTVVTCVVTDTSGNTNQCTFDVTVNDDEDPMITCPASTTVGSDLGLCGAVLNYSTPTGTDNCGVQSVVCTPPSGTFVPTGTTTVTCVVTDTSGNTNECSFNVTVKDVEKPTITCPSNVMTGTDAGLCTAVVNFAPPTTDDNCSVFQVTSTPPSGSVFNVGTTTVSCVVFDTSGNSEQCSFDVTVTDDELPVAVCQDITVAVPGSGSVTIVPADVDGGSTDNCGITMRSLSQDTFVTADIGSTVTVILTVEDAAGNMDTCEALVCVGAEIDSTGGMASFDPGGGVEVDIDVPAGAVSDGTVFTAKPATAPTECETGVSLVSVGSWAIGATDTLAMPVDVTVHWLDSNNDGTVDSTVIDETTLQVCHDGVTITDVCSAEPVGGSLPDCDTAANTFQFEVAGFSQFTLYTGTTGMLTCDSGGPYAPTECLGTSTPVLLDGSASSAGVTYAWTVDVGCTATFDDATLAMPTLTFSQAEDCDVTLTVTAGGGSDMAQCPAETVSVVDTTAPEITLLGDDPMTVECGADFVDPGATASDVCEGDLTLFIVATGVVDTSTPGTYMVEYDVSDSVPNAATTVTRTVEVEDNTPPVITLVGDDPLHLECGTAYVDPGAMAMDDCDDDGTLTAAIMIDSSAVDPATPGVYPVTYDVMDSSGNPAVQVTRTVNVSDGTPPSITCPDQVRPTNVGCTWVPPGGGGASLLNHGQVVSDNCSELGDITIANDAPAAFPQGTTVVHWTATDEAGNVGMCTQVITVVDETPPAISCSSVVRSTNVDCMFVPVDGGGASLLVDGVTAVDNCSPTSEITLTSNAAPSYGLGTHMIEWTATDAAGNSASCMQSVTVVDGTAPDLVCPPDLTRGANSGMEWVPEPGDLGMAVATDNCPGDVTVVNDAPASFPQGDTVVQWTATDEAGNLAICTQTVTVQDAMAPEITCPVSLTTEPNASNPEGACVFVGDFGTPTVMDDDSDMSEIVVTNDAPGAFPLGETVVTWTATDMGGNSSSCEQVVTVVDLSPPVLICPPVVNALCTSPEGAEIDLNIVATDNCDMDPVVEITPPADSVFPPGLTEVTVVATDAEGNVSSCNFTVSVVCGGLVIPGDCNQDGEVDISDAVCEINFLFLGLGGPLPCGDGSLDHIGNRRLLSWFDDVDIDLSDAIALLQWKFLGGPQHFLGVTCQAIEACPENCSITGPTQ